MISKVFNLIFLFASCWVFGQNSVRGTIIDQATQKPLDQVQLFDKQTGYLTTTDLRGNFQFQTEKKAPFMLLIMTVESSIQEIIIDPLSTESLTIEFTPKVEYLSEVILRAQRIQAFQLKRMADSEGTTIYAGKKNEVILVDQTMANLATNNARQVYSQIPGLNIYQNDDAGLQLHIGGRGLDPNRTSNFNTRQNNYDISADVLGYPESYYTPPAEALAEIQILRGAASLQYGTQFGGLVNFITKAPHPTKPIEVVSRNTVGSNALYTNFTSLSGTKNKLGYYTFVNYKKGNGFRENSTFNATNVFTNLIYKINETTEVSGEFTYLNYLAQQAGGLTDTMFAEDPFQSNRTRNWFELNWLLYNIKFKKEWSTNTRFSLNLFGLNATRKALGFRSNRVDQVDPMEERDLISGDFKNIGLESRFLNKYTLFNKKAVFLIGTKWYLSNNSSEQGPGSSDAAANFNFQYDRYPNYTNQSRYRYPNFNAAFFGENIFYLNDKISLTPGFRYEIIQTESDGFYKQINLDAAGNPILKDTFEEQEVKKRAFLLMGLGVSYKPLASLEIYGNISENYRSVSFSDISISNPAYAINPNIADERGTTLDVGFRGKIKEILSFDVSVFNLNYNDRIGFVQKVTDFGNVKSERGNVGDAVIYGLESLLDVDLKRLLNLNDKISGNYFLNTSFINSKYTQSDVPGIAGKEVEFVPQTNIKTGLRLGYQDVMFNLQYSYIDKQYTDASNAIESNLSGVIGQIPAYAVVDLSTAYFFKNFKVELGINNLLNNTYFTRRATGYPGPGIIPSAPRTSYITLQLKI